MVIRTSSRENVHLPQWLLYIYNFTFFHCNPNLNNYTLDSMTYTFAFIPHGFLDTYTFPTPTLIANNLLIKDINIPRVSIRTLF